MISIFLLKFAEYLEIQNLSKHPFILDEKLIVKWKIIGWVTVYLELILVFISAFEFVFFLISRIF